MSYDPPPSYREMRASQASGHVVFWFIALSFLVGWLMDRYDCWSLIECLTRGEPWR